MTVTGAAPPSGGDARHAISPLSSAQRRESERLAAPDDRKVRQPVVGRRAPHDRAAAVVETESDLAAPDDRALLVRIERPRVPVLLADDDERPAVRTACEESARCRNPCPVPDRPDTSRTCCRSARSAGTCQGNRGRTRRSPSPDFVQRRAPVSRSNATTASDASAAGSV